MMIYFVVIDLKKIIMIIIKKKVQPQHYKQNLSQTTFELEAKIRTTYKQNHFEKRYINTPYLFIPNIWRGVSHVTCLQHV